MQKIDAPVAEIIPYEHEEHGAKRLDNYFWLRDDERKNEKVIAYLNAENEYLKAALSHTDKLQEKLYQEMKARIKEDDSSVPYQKGSYFYYNRSEEGKEYSLRCRKKSEQATEEEVLLDENKRAEGKPYYAVGTFKVSPNEQILAFSEDTIGRRRYNLRFKDLNTGDLTQDTIQDIEGVVWAADNKTIFYVKKHPKTLRSYQVWKYNLADKTNKLVFEENDESYYTSISKSKSEDYIFINLSSTLTSEVLMIPADKPNAKFEVFYARSEKHEYDIEHRDDKFYIRSNHEAPNFKLFEVQVGKQSDMKNWKTLIEHRKDVLLEGIEVFNDFMVVVERKEGLLQFQIRDEKNNTAHYVPFADPTYSAYIAQNYEMDSHVLRYGYTSLTRPSSVFDYDMKTQETELKKEQEVLGGFDSQNYVSERVYATARDGVKVPISIVYRKGLKKDGKSPLYINAYGSYGASMDAYFSSIRLTLLDRGFVFALAHIRGGEEMGRHWYEDGKLLKKKNTFTDFIDCTKFLQAEGYGSPENTFAMGGSAGGLLMGAVANMQPDIYKGMIAHVPFVDVISTMMDASIPLTTNEYDEWGNPNEKEYYDYMRAYSPYDNVVAQAYPNILVTTGFHDSQVQYWEPAKWVAKLRATKTDENALYFYTNMDAGHGGASGRFSRLREYALEYAFILDLLGIKE
ncbi:MAG: S9 family peptidase [Bernardetiaceae bacterium]|nr:S9 family peptidase [Bernardetiaceae bacterium]